VEAEMATPKGVARSVLKIAAMGILAAMIAVVAGGVWSGLLLANLQTNPKVPWSVAAMAILLWTAWMYLGGHGWPPSTSNARREHLRAYRRPWRVFAWAGVAGGLAVASLAGLWIVLFQLVRMPRNALPDFSAYPRLTILLMILMGSIVAPLMEEAAFRGYFQVTLERSVRSPVLVVGISSLLFALVHGPTQGFLWPKLLFYFLVGITFGAIAYLTKSILPAIPVHCVGLFVFFMWIWPHDPQRQNILASGADKWFWIHLAQTIAFSSAAIWAFVQLGRVSAMRAKDG